MSHLARNILGMNLHRDLHGATFDHNTQVTFPKHVVKTANLEVQNAINYAHRGPKQLHLKEKKVGIREILDLETAQNVPNHRPHPRLLGVGLILRSTDIYGQCGGYLLQEKLSQIL